MTWPLPKFAYRQRVRIIPNDGVEARVLDLHYLGQDGTVEYQVRYFHGGEAKSIRVLEDELEAAEQLISYPDCPVCPRPPDKHPGCPYISCPMRKKEIQS